MVRTFSLMRLLLGMTALCVVTGVAVNLPLETLLLAPVAAFFVPTLLVLALVSLHSPRPRTTFLVGAIGAAIALGFIMPEIAYPGAHTSWWTCFEHNPTIGILPALGALMFSAPCTIGRW